MTRLMEILKIQLEEQLLIKYCVIKHLRLLKIQNMMDIKGVILQWFINLLIKRLLVEVFKMIIYSFQFIQLFVCNMKNVFQLGCILVDSVNFVIQNMCVQNKCGAAFQFIKLSLVSYFYNTKTFVFKSSGRLLFILFSDFGILETSLFKSSGGLLFQFLRSFL